MKVLCIDIDGGYGGSSRSLYFSLKQLVDRVQPLVLCEKSGPIVSAYQAIGIEVRITPNLPRFTPLARLSRNIFTGSVFIYKWFKAKQFRENLVHQASSVDIIHLNHESLIPLGVYLRRHYGFRVCVHLRTQPPSTIFSRIMGRGISDLSGAVFITENEKRHWSGLAGVPLNGPVIHNIGARPAAGTRPHEAILDNGHLKVGVLGNFDFIRGHDRLIEICLELKRRHCKSVHFIVAGNMTLKGKMRGKLGELVGQGKTLGDYAHVMGVAEYFTFTGHVPHPEQVVVGCDIVLKPSRENNPWGRDVIEAMAAGKPVIGIGTYDKFVQTDATGLLQGSFNAPKLAEYLIEMDRSPQKLKLLSKEALSRAHKYFAPQTQSMKLYAFWADVLRAEA